MQKINRGFTLLEMSVVLVIIGTLSAGAIVMANRAISQKQDSDTQGKLNAIQAALHAFEKAHNRIPCPGDSTLARSDTNFGFEAAGPGACNTGATYDSGGNRTANGGSITANALTLMVAEGMVPVKTLGLSEDFATDGWGRRIAYAVDTRYTATDAFVNIPSTSDAGNITVWDSVGNVRGSAPGGISLPINSVQFIGTNTAVQGQWIGNFGTDGYKIYDSTDSNPPGYVGVSGSGTQYAWIPDGYGSLPDPRALQTTTAPNDTSQGWATALYSDPSFEIDLDFSNNMTHKVSLYLMDWDNYSRIERIDVLDQSSNVLDTKTISSFGPGIYYSWYATGHLRFIFTNLVAGKNAVVTGIFFDPPGGQYTTAGIYALVSYGPNGHGAYPRNGGTTRVSNFLNATGGSDELVDCACDADAHNNPFTPYFVQKMDGVDHYDDMVVYGTRGEFP